MKIEIINNFEFTIKQHPGVDDSRLAYSQQRRYINCVVREYKCRYCKKIALSTQSVNYKIAELIIIQQDELALELHLMVCPDYAKKKKPYYNNDISK